MVAYIKNVASRPDWLNTSHVEDIYRLSHDFSDYTNYGKDNGFWLMMRTDRRN